MKKDHYIKVRVSEREWGKLNAHADAQGVSISAFVRSAALASCEPTPSIAEDPTIKQMAMDLADTFTTVGDGNDKLEQVLQIVRELLALRDPQAAIRLAASSPNARSS